MQVYQVGDTALIAVSLTDIPDGQVYLTLTTESTVVLEQVLMTYDDGSGTWQYSRTIPFDAVQDIYSGTANYVVDSSPASVAVTPFKVGTLYVSVAQVRTTPSGYDFTSMSDAEIAGYIDMVQGIVDSYLNRSYGSGTYTEKGE